MSSQDTLPDTYLTLLDRQILERNLLEESQRLAREALAATQVAERDTCMKHLWADIPPPAVDINANITPHTTRCPVVCMYAFGEERLVVDCADLEKGAANLQHLKGLFALRRVSAGMQEKVIRERNRLMGNAARAAHRRKTREARRLQLHADA
jgi:hypothetical protein